MTEKNEELKKLQIEDDVDRTELFGSMDANLNLIQEKTGVEIFQRDDCLLLRGEKLELAEGILSELMDILRVGENLDVQKVNYVISLKEQGLSYRENNVSKDIICFTSKGRPIKPKTIGQKDYVNSIRKKDIVFGIGPPEREKLISPWPWRSMRLRIKKCRRLYWQDLPSKQARDWVSFLEICRKRWILTCGHCTMRCMIFWDGKTRFV